MFYIILSICCSVIVSILLKLARRYIIHVPQAVAWNYLIAMGLTFYFYRPSFLQNVPLADAPWYLYLSLGVLLPALFLIIAASVRYTGIVRTDVAQRLSLFIPLTAAFLLFGESVSTWKAIGIVFGFVAILLCIRWQSSRTGRGTIHTWVYPLIVFSGMGIIDILFKQIAAFRLVPYTTSLLIVFALSFFVSIAGLIYLFIIKKQRFSWRHIGFGAILGFFNFGNILFYLKAHQAISKNPSVVFSLMNIGVIVLGTLVGVLIFREKLSRWNKVGILLALAAILITSLTY
ncbi:MAG: EamA/RhaT family transporter [Sphingobacteriaceae bacterium]